MDTAVEEIKFAVPVATLGSIILLAWSILLEQNIANVSLFYMFNIPSFLMLAGSVLILFSSAIRIFGGIVRNVKIPILNKKGLYSEKNIIGISEKWIFYILLVVGIFAFTINLVEVSLSLTGLI